MSQWHFTKVTVTSQVSIAGGTTRRPFNHQGGNYAKYLETCTQQVYTSCNLEITLWRHKGHQHPNSCIFRRCWKSLAGHNTVVHHLRAASEFCMNIDIHVVVCWTYTRRMVQSSGQQMVTRQVDISQQQADGASLQHGLYSSQLLFLFCYVLQLSSSTGAVLQLSRLYRVFSGFKEVSRVQSEDKRISTKRLLIQTQLLESLLNTF